MKHILHIFTLGILLIFLTPLRGDVGIIVLNKKDVLRPGAIYTLMIRLENSGSEIPLDSVEIAAPEFISILTKKTPVSISEGDRSKIFMSFNVQENAEAGGFEMRISLKNSGNIIAEEILEFEIEELHRLDIQMLEKPAQINGSDTVTCRYLVLNSGNVDEEIILSSRAGEFADRKVSIAAGKSQSIPVEKFISGDQSQAGTIIMDLQATIVKLDTTYSLNVPISYYPTRTMKLDKYHRFPVAIDLSLLHFSDGRNNINAGRYNVRGLGYLDRRQKFLFGFNARGPNQYDQVQFGQYDEHNLQLTVKSFGSLSIGDLGISLSPLTEYSRFGKGFRYTQELGPLSVSGFKIKPRFFPDSDLIYGFNGKWQVSDRIALEGNWLKKNFLLYENEPESTVKSIGASYDARQFSLELEGAQSDFLGTRDYASRANFNYSNELFYIGGNLLYAGDSFRGYYRSTSLLSLHGRLNITNKWSVSVTGTSNNSTPDQDTIAREILPRSIYYSAGVQYKMDSRRSLAFQLLTSSKKDRIEPIDYDFLDRLAQVTYNFRNEVMELNGQISYGSTYNYLIEAGNREDQKGNSLRTNIFFSRQFNDRLRLGGLVEYQNTNKYSTFRTNQQYLFYGARMSFQQSERFIFSFNYRSNYPLDELYKPRSFLDGELNYQWTEDQLVSANIGYSVFPSNGNAKQLYAAVKYSHILNIPLKKILDLGSLKGQVIGNHGEKVSGIIISLAGLQVVTDLSGHFEFIDIPPGEHYLQIDAGSLAMNEIARDFLPISVQIKAQETIEQNIEIVKSSAIKGAVDFLEEESTQSEAFVKKRPAVFLKLEKDKTTYYTKVDDRGQFQFLSLRPGVWKLSVLDSGWDGDFEINYKEKEIEVEAGAEENIKLTVKPKTRRLRFSKQKIKVN